MATPANSYTLQTSVMPCGTVTVTLYSSIAGLTVPTFQSLLLMNELTENVDVVAGTTDIPTMEFTYIEDYSVHSEGFWFKVLNGDMELKIVLNDGVVSGCFFWGIKEPVQIQQEEYSLLSGAMPGRNGRFTLVSKITQLRETLVSDIITAAFADAVKVTTITGWGGTVTELIISVRRVLAHILNTGFSSGGVDDTDVAVSTDQDFEFSPDNSYWYKLYSKYIYMSCGNYNGGPNVKGGYFATDQWAAKYKDGLSLLFGLAAEFGLVPYYLYNMSTARHTIQLFNRGHDGLDLTMPYAPIQSTRWGSGDKKVSSIYLRMMKSGNEAYRVCENVQTGTPPVDLDFDMNLTRMFRTGTGAYPSDLTEALMYYTGVGNPSLIGYYKWWDYSTGALSSSTPDSYAAHLAYMYRRFATEKRKYERKYPTLQATYSATTSWSYPRLGNLVSIDGGSGATDFYITGMTRNLFENTMKINFNQV